jgi:hypothetical protein
MSSLKSGQSAIEDNDEKTVITASDAYQPVATLDAARGLPSGIPAGNAIGFSQTVDHIKISLYV